MKEVQIDDAWQPSDECYADTIDRILHSVEVGGKPEKDDQLIRGLTIVFGAKNYDFKRPIILTRPAQLRGSGGPLNYGGSWLRFPKDGDGIVFDRSDTSVSPQIPHGAGGSVSNLSLTQRERGSKGVGIRIKARSVTVRDVNVGSFGGHGIEIDSKTGIAGEPNCNLWMIENCRVDSCGGNGLHVDGEDSNAGMAIKLDCQSNNGYAVYDGSDMGNTYIGCHAASNKAGAYKTIDDSAYCLFLGCYAEKDNDSEFTGPSLKVGGHGSLSKRHAAIGNHNAGLSLSPFAFSFTEPQGKLEDADKEKPIYAAIGETDKNSVFEFGGKVDAPLTAYNLRFSTENPGWWEFATKNTNRVALALSCRDRSKKPAAEGEGFPWMPRGVFLGRTAGLEDAPIYLTARSQPPDPSKTEQVRNFKQGDIVLNTSPVVGGHVGWIFAAIDNGRLEWRKFGKIE